MRSRSSESNIANMASRVRADARKSNCFQLDIVLARHRLSPSAQRVWKQIHISNATTPVTISAKAHIRSRLIHDRRSIPSPNF